MLVAPLWCDQRRCSPTVVVLKCLHDLAKIWFDNGNIHYADSCNQVNSTRAKNPNPGNAIAQHHPMIHLASILSCYVSLNLYIKPQLLLIGQNIYGEVIAQI